MDRESEKMATINLYFEHVQKLTKIKKINLFCFDNNLG